MKAGENEIPRKPLLWLAVALVFTVPPMFRSLSPWVPLLFTGVLFLKFWMQRRGMHLRHPALKILLVLAALGAVQLTYHSLFGLESGLSLFLLMSCIKILEAHTARDFHTVALLGWFLCLAGLFISQELSAGIYAVTAFVLILGAVAQFHRGPGARRPVAGAFKTSLGLLLRATPLILALFFFFPRGSGPIRFDLRHSFMGRAGMSNELHPGTIASLALSNEVAFRVEFPDGNMPALGNLYWRGGILTQDHGLAWSVSPGDEFGHPPEQLSPGGVRQRIILQPHGNFWIFALEWPSDAPHGTHMLRGNVLRSTRPVYSQWHYDVVSSPRNREIDPDPEELKNCRQVQKGLASQQVKDLVASWTQKSTDPHAIIENALDFFHTQRFQYTLTPGEYSDRTGLDDFLFRRRRGFCEHYAAAFATLMRVAGIPSRVVIGYQGGQFNSLGKYLVVHQSDAHAWCEVWIPGEGWQRIDPTAAVAPERVSMGFSSFMDMRGGSDASVLADAGQAAGGWRHKAFFNNLRLAWEAVSYLWDSHVANFDDETQQSFFLELGWLQTGPVRLLACLLALGVVLLGAQVLWTLWRTRPASDPLKAAYLRFCKRLAALGVKREPWEGPQNFAERAAETLPAHAGDIRRVAGLYIALRYSPRADKTAQTEFAREVKAFPGAARV